MLSIRASAFRLRVRLPIGITHVHTRLSCTARTALSSHAPQHEARTAHTYSPQCGLHAAGHARTPKHLSVSCGSRSTRYDQAQGLRLRRPISFTVFAGRSDGSGVPAGFVAPKKINLDDYPPPSRKLTKDDVQFQFVRSGGAGGQNVNKVNTKCDMRFDFLSVDWIPDWVKDNMMNQEAGRINNDMMLVVNSTRHRTQGKNLDDALQKLQAMIDAAAKPPTGPTEEKIKKVKKLAKKANQRRLDQKKKKSGKKDDRRQNKRGNWD